MSDTGFIHKPQNDIQAIRDLLEGYGDAKSILKELIQNAEDAEATEFEMIHFGSSPEDAPHPLLRGPGLCVVNNGPFKKEHREGIFSIGVGTKAADDRRIGRFGKGLKSVFSVCEAFFLLGSHQSTDGWENHVWLLNPYQDWRHADWNAAFDSGRVTIEKYLYAKLEALGWNDGEWLAFWFPLRNSNHLKDEKGPVHPLHHWGGPNDTLPGENENFAQELSTHFLEAAPRLLLLHRLHTFRFRYGENINAEISYHFSDSSTRPSSIYEENQLETISGEISGSQNIHYHGFVGHLTDPEFQTLHNRSDWPTTIDASGSTDSVGVKGQPHYGCIFSTIPSGYQSLSIEWAVFLPVSSQLDSSSLALDPKLWPNKVSLLLHGCFFLDSRRTGIDGLLEGFPDPVAKNSPADGKNLATQEWNRLLAHKGTLAEIPHALSEFLKSTAATTEAIADLVEAFKRSRLWKTFSQEITQKWRYLFATQDGHSHWELKEATKPVLYVPAYADGTKDRIQAIRDLWSLFPNLGELAQEFCIVHQPAADAGLVDESDVQTLESPQLATLFQRIDLTEKNRSQFIHWIETFFQSAPVPDEIRRILRTLPLIKIASASDASDVRWINAEEAEAKVSDGLLCKKNYSIRKSLHKAIPQLSLFLYDGNFRTDGSFPMLDLLGVRIGELNLRSVAAILGRSEQLAPPHQRKALLQWMLNQPGDDPPVKAPLRYLLHGSPANRNDSSTQLLFEDSSTTSEIWARLIEGIVEQEDASKTWRWIDADLANKLDGDERMRLNLQPVGARACLEELNTIPVERLCFPSGEWTESDIEQLMAGLYADQNTRPSAVSILSRLPIHSVERDGSGQRVSIADEAGRLLRHHLLEVPEFENQILDSAFPEWELLLRSVTVIRAYSSESNAASAQRALFQDSDPDGERLEWKLTWHNITRILLELPEPHQFVNLLLNALEKAGGSAISGLGPKIRATRLFSLKNGSIIAAGAIAHLDGLESELDELFASSRETFTLLDLPQSLTKNDVFRKNLSSLLPGPTDVFTKIRHCFLNDSKWHLGIDSDRLPADWQSFLQSIEACPEIPVASLILKLSAKKGTVSEENFKAAIISPALKPWVSSEADRYTHTLAWIANQNRIELHATYLREVAAGGHLPQILPDLQLRNQNGHWQKASELIWPTEGPPLEHQLHSEEESIIAEACGAALPDEDGLEIETGERETDTFAANTLAKNSEEMIAYLKSFEHCESHAALAASFVAICFDDERLHRYANEIYLQSEGKSMGHLRELLFEGAGGSSYDFAGKGTWGNAVFSFQFQKEADSREYPTITGGRKRIELDSSPVSLLADSRHSMNVVGTYQGRPVRELILRRFPHPEQIQDLTEVWRRTLRLIVIYSYQLPPTLCPDFQSLIKLCGHSVELRRVQSILLDVAESRIKELRCHSHPGFREIMADFDAARDARLAAQDFRDQGLDERAAESDSLERDKRKEAEYNVKQLLRATPPDAAEAQLIESTRTRLDEFGYSPESTLMELFQNADDALNERLAESAQLIDATSPDFILRWSPEQNALCILHWGRSINNPMSHDPSSKASKAYSRDLEKMLSLNLSDKVDSAVALTGRFGLGFKSIFFLCDHPSVLSGPLRFTIRGAWYPELPDRETAATLKEVASKEVAPDALTLLHLPDLRIEPAKLKRLLETFLATAPYLVYFAKSIRCLKFEDGSQTRIFERSQPEDKNWLISHHEAGPRALVVFSEDNPETAAQWIFELDRNGFLTRQDTIPAIWSTAPTQESSKFGFCINGDWKLDAGRLRIARECDSTREVAHDLAHSLRSALESIITDATEDWATFRASAGFDEALTAYQFWRSFWSVVTAAPPVLDWQNIVAAQADIAGAILWDTQFGALTGLLYEHSIIPSGLGGSHLQLVAASDATHYLRGILNDCHSLRETCMEWTEFTHRHNPGTVVQASVKDYLDPIRVAAGAPPLTAITMADLLKMFTGANQVISASAAARLGGIFNREQWKRLEAQTHGPELKQLREQLRHLHFPTVGGGSALASELIGAYQVTGVDAVDREETRRAALAPPERLLAKGFDANGLRFFTMCREKPGANAEVMAEWVRHRSQERLIEVFDYLYDGHSNGELAQKLADALGRDWLDRNEPSPAFQNLTTARQQEIWRLFKKVNYAPPVGSLVQPTLQIDPAEAYRRISNWWSRESAAQLPYYLSTFYGQLAPTVLPWPADDAWGFPGDSENLAARREWMILFIHAALHTQGWYKVGRHREFLAFLARNGWLDILANPNSPASDHTRILDEFLGDNPEAIVYYHSMRQFISFYASSRHLESVVEGLANIEKKTQPWPLREAFSLGLNTDFAGTGLVAPSFEQGFGPGAHFVLRELYRLKRLNNPHGLEHAFVLPKGTCRFCEFAFGLPNFGELNWREDVSRTLYSRLRQLDAKLDPTFDRCFDIPLAILSETPSLQESLLGGAIQTQEEPDVPEVDSSSGD